MPETMRAAVIDRPGNPDVLRLDEVAHPTPINSEFLVKVVAAGINPIDAKTRAGAGVFAAIDRLPAVLGHDFSGVVVQSPFSAHPIKPGDEVFGMVMVPRFGGSYAEYVSVPSMSVVRKPSTLSHIEAAAVPVAAMTAWGLVVDVARAHDGQRILIHAGAGGVGHFAVQLAAYFGAYVITTGSEKNRAWLHQLGAAEVIDYRSARFEDTVSEVDVVVDLIGNVHENTGSRSLRVLRSGGLIINVPTGSWPTFAEDAASAGVRGTNFKVSPDGNVLAVISRLLESGAIRAQVDGIFDLGEAAAAHRALELGHTRGKIVLKVAEG